MKGLKITDAHSQLPSAHSATDVPAADAAALLGQIEEQNTQMIELQLQLQELQAKQQESELIIQHYTALFDHSPVRLICLDHLSRIRQINSPAAALLGAERRDVMGQTFTRFMTGDDRDRLRELIRQASLGTAPVSATLALKVNGQPTEENFHLVAVGIPVSHDANVQLCQIAINDLNAVSTAPAAPSSLTRAEPKPLPLVEPPDTEEARARAQAELFLTGIVNRLRVPEEELRAQAHLARAWLESMAGGAMLCDVHGKIVLINSAAAFLLSDIVETCPVIHSIEDCWEEDKYFQPDTHRPYSMDDFPMQRIACGETIAGEEVLVSNLYDGEDLRLTISGYRLHDMQGDCCGFVIRLQHSSLFDK